MNPADTGAELRMECAQMRTLLVVDDHESVRQTLAFVLGRPGWRVVTVESGKAAVEWAAREAVDAALVDLHMPELDGFQGRFDGLKVPSMSRDSGSRVLAGELRMKELAGRIRAVRVGLGLSQGDFARLIGGGVTQQMVSDWERGRRLGAVVKAARLWRILERAEWKRAEMPNSESKVKIEP